MTAALWFLLRLALLAGLAIWLSLDPGTVNIIWRGYHIETSVAFTGFCIVLVSILWSFCDRLLRWVLHTPEKYRQYRHLQRREQGYRALTSGFVAVAAGDTQVAQQSAQAAEKRIGDVPLTLLLSAQAAQLGGDHLRAQKIFEELLAHDTASFLGLRGLLAEKLRVQDHAGALVLVEAAARQQPKRQWILEQLLSLQVNAQDWLRALATLDRLQKSSFVDLAKAKKQKIALLLAQARAAKKNHDSGLEQRAVYKAYRLDPFFVPTVCAWADILVSFGRIKAAQKVLQKSYARAPHLDVSSRWMGFYKDAAKQSPYQRDRQKYLWAKILAGEWKKNKTVERFLGHVALSAGLWDEAQGHFAVAGGQEEVMPPWICSACSYESQQWQAVCTRCHGLATVSYTQE